MSDFIAWFADIALADRLAVGGKGGSLGEMTRAGIAVPPGFAVRTEAFERFLATLEAEAPVRDAVAALDPDDLDGLTRAAETIRQHVEATPLPPEVERAIRAAHGRLLGVGADDPVAIRSSATTEDSEDASFAGLQDTYLWVKGAAETVVAVRRCWASFYSVPSIGYRLKHAMPEAGVAMGVVVQRMVDARSAGVMFTRSPISGDRSVVTIEASWGLGSAVVGGEVTPDRFVIGKITREISSRTISDKRIEHIPAPGGGVREAAVDQTRRQSPAVSDDELMALADLAQSVEAHYGRPQDIEWAIARDTGEIFLLQSRPETVWANRDRAPVAKPAASAMDHVLNLFGGKR